MKLIYIFQISLILTLFTSSIKSEFDYESVAEIIDKYNNFPNTYMKDLLKSTLVRFLKTGIDLLKKDDTIYTGSKKEAVDEIENYVNIFEFSENSQEEEKYLDLILDNAKVLWRSRDEIQKELISNRIKESLEKLNQIMNIASSNKDVVYDENYFRNKDKDTTDGTKKNNLKPGTNDTDAFPSFHVIIIIVILILVGVFVFYLVKRRMKLSATTNDGYDRQVENY